MIISPIPINKVIINNISLNGGQFIYCLDTKEVYYDDDSSGEVNRIALANTTQLAIESEREKIESPDKDMIYIVVSTNRLYRYTDSWQEITSTDDCKDLIYSATNLKPITITQNNIKCAPMTLASQVYTSDGSTAQDFVNKYLNNNKKVKLRKKSAYVEARRDMQRMYTIPYPTSNYDLNKFPMVVAVNNDILDSDEYAVSNEQIILEQSIGDEIKKGDIIRFIFAWSATETDEIGDSASSIDDHEFYISTEEPDDPKDGTFWFDLTSNTIKYWDDQLKQWVEFVGSAKGNSIKRTVIIYTTTDTINISIDDYDQKEDTLMVYRDGKYLDQYIDYVVSDDNSKIKSLDTNGWEIAEGAHSKFTFLIFKDMKPDTSGIYNSLVEFAENLCRSSVSYIITGDCADTVVNDEAVASNIVQFIVNYINDNEDQLSNINTNDDDPFEILDILSAIVDVITES